MFSISFLLSLLLATQSVVVDGFVPPPSAGVQIRSPCASTGCGLTRSTTDCHDAHHRVGVRLQSNNDGNASQEDCHDDWEEGKGDAPPLFVQSRRSALLRGAAGLGSSVLLGSARPTSAASATATTIQTSDATIATDVVPNVQCLADLPPITPGCVRIYLCRHGQTENNRLHLVQGARIDPSLNGVGRSMATRVGLAMSYLPDANKVPKVVTHSQLRRARETALIASATLDEVRGDRKRRGGVDDASSAEAAALVENWATRDVVVPSGNDLNKLPFKYITLPSLGEVDFGAGYEGKSSTEVKAGMMMTYGAWALGVIDQRMDGEGESGREVLGRTASALTSLAEIAKDNGGSVLAVSHSTYLRTLLGTVLDVPLSRAAQMEQRNGCINVLDVSVSGATTTLGPKSNIFGGSLSMAKDDFNLTIPETTVIRVNEFRHMEGITW